MTGNLGNNKDSGQRSVVSEKRKRGFHWSLVTGHWSLLSKGQASLEMTVALMGTLLLLFGSVKVFTWMTQRLVTRQQGYEATRVAAGSDLSGAAVGWSEPSEPLRIFDE